MTPKDITQHIKRLAKEVGFDAVGIAKAEPLTDTDLRLKQWIEKDYHGEMNFFLRNHNKRINPELVLPGCRSVVVLLINYRSPLVKSWISEYGRSKDYHVVVKELIRDLLSRLKSTFKIDIPNHIFCDSSSLMEKVWATKAGLGMQGKHTLLINPDLGTKFFIGGFLTSIEAEPTLSNPSNMCEDCRLCIDNCPTQALAEPGILDARKCISYQTIENKGNIPEEIKKSMTESIFGCDICQNVCPWNNSHSMAFNEKII
jgi:epoxyqueuosine reductase